MLERMPSAMVESGSESGSMPIGEDVVREVMDSPDFAIAPHEIPQIEGASLSKAELAKELGYMAAVILVMYLGYRVMTKGLRDAKRKHGSVL